MAQVFITTEKLRSFDVSLKRVIEGEPSWAREQAVVAQSMLANREHLDGVTKLTVQGPERVVEALVSLIGSVSL